MNFSAESESTANEVLDEAPSLFNPDGGLNVNYLSEFSDYFDGRFGLRNLMISAEHTIVAAIFKESSEDKVILGKDGWLFYKEALDDYEGVNLLSDRDIYAASKTLSLMNEYCLGKGMDFVFTIAPNKNSLYAEKMPSYYPRSTRPSNAQRLEKQLAKTDVTYVNLFDVFNSESKILYRKTDSHWTCEGAGLAADCILTAIGKDFIPYYGTETREASDRAGDLFEMLYPSKNDTSPDTVYKRAFSFSYERPIRSVEDNFITTLSDTESGNLFMFRDSFGNTLYQFLAGEFSRSVFCRLIPYNLSLAENEGADTVIVEIVERNIEWLLSKGAVFAAPERKLQAIDCRDITAATKITHSASDELAGFSKIEGLVESNTLKTEDNIYIVVSGTAYEATPGTQDSFTAYIPSDKLSENIAIVINNN